MKKILAIAITLVMVFAVAASAFALFGFQASAQPIQADNIVVDVSIYDNDDTATTNSLVGGKYPVHAPTSGVRAGDAVIARVDLSVPKFDSLTAKGQALMAAATTGMTITVSNMKEAATLSLAGKDLGYADDADLQEVLFADFTNGVYTQTVTAINNKVTTDLPVADGEPKSNIGWLVVGAVDKLADCTISATFGAPDPAVTATEADQACHIGNFNVTVDDVDVITEYVMTQYNPGPTGAPNWGSATGNKVSFAVSGPDSAGNYAILDTFVTIGSDVYRVAQDPTSSEIIFIKSDARIYDFTELSTLNAVLADAMGDMGFTWTPGGVLYSAGFEALAAVGMQFSDSATYYAYTAALTVPGTAVVPDTGDNTVVGIVMMAVAVLATAAIVINKVRA